MLKLWNVFSDFSAYRNIFWTFRRVFPRLASSPRRATVFNKYMCSSGVHCKISRAQRSFFIIFQNWSWQQSYNTLVKVRNKVNNSVGYYSLLCDWRFKIKQIHCAQNRMEVLCLHSLVDPWGPGDPIVTFWGTRKIILGSKNRREDFFRILIEQFLKV